MSPRSPLLVAVIAAGLALAACSVTVSPAPVASPDPGSPSLPVSPPAPDPTRVPEATLLPEPTPTPVIGGVDGDATGPELTVIASDAGTITATITDPAAKAWQLEVLGAGGQALDAWRITVEAGDVGPRIAATEIVDGEVIDELDLTGIWDGTAIAGACHSTLPVCLDTSGFRFPDNGDGTFSVQLHLEDAATTLQLRGAAAYWDGEPFVLGPWHTTDAFPWEPAG
jgi:hypothetical protein